MAGSVLGPELPTLAERFVSLFRLPYAIGCGILALFSAGPISLIVLRPYISPPALVPLNLALWFLFAYYAFYAPFYIRRRVLQTESSILPLLPNGERDFHEHFGRVSALKPQIVLWVFFSIGFIFPFLRHENYPIANVASTLIAVGVASSIWAYYSSLIGIHRLGRVPFEVAPYFDDRTLGLRPLGSLALSLAITYFLGNSVGLGLTLFSSDPTLYLSQAAIIMAGLVMFFLPLRRLHQRMAEQKRKEKEKFKQKFGEVFKASVEADSPNDFSRFYKLEFMEKRISAIAVWPYDLQILGKLSVIVLSVTAVLLARVIAAYLGLVVPLG